MDKNVAWAIICTFGAGFLLVWLFMAFQYPGLLIPLFGIPLLWALYTVGSK